MLSTRTRGEEGCEWAKLAMRDTSINRRVGFVGDSIQMSYFIKIENSVEKFMDRVAHLGIWLDCSQNRLIVCVLQI